jgi:hypothetical protein
MERRHSFGGEACRGVQRRRLERDGEVRFGEVSGSAVNYPGNPRFRPTSAFKTAHTTQEMDDRCQLLTIRAIVITDEGSMSAHSREEVKDIIQFHFGINKLEFSVYRSNPEPFLAMFRDEHDRDAIFADRRVVDGPIELGFHAWEVDRFGERGLLPFHVRVSLEGLPHHAWVPEVAEKVLGDETIITHVEEDTQKKVDQRTYNCWVLCKDPSRFPQMVFLTLAKYERVFNRSAQVHFSRPREVKHNNTFKVIIHIDAVKDLMLYHSPREELIADGKVPWREFNWHLGKLDGELHEDELFPPTARCGQNQ